MKDTGLTFPAADSGPPIERGRIGVWLLLVVETMFFVGLLGAFVIVRKAASDWPAPYRILATGRDSAGAPSEITVQPPRLELTWPMINAAVLTAAFIAALLAQRAAKRADIARVRFFLGVTAVCGVGFLAGIVAEYLHESARGLTLQSGQYGSMIFMITGAHAAHVLGGLIWQFFVLVPALARPFGLRASRIEYLGIYWGFVTVLWYVLLVLLHL